MRIKVTIKRFKGKRPVVVEGIFGDQDGHQTLGGTLESARAIWEAEQLLNGLPGTDLRWHFEVLS